MLSKAIGRWRSIHVALTIRFDSLNDCLNVAKRKSAFPINIKSRRKGALAEETLALPFRLASVKLYALN